MDKLNSVDLRKQSTLILQANKLKQMRLCWTALMLHGNLNIKYRKQANRIENQSCLNDEAYHLISKHQNSFEGQLPVTKTEKIFKAWSQ